MLIDALCMFVMPRIASMHSMREMPSPLYTSCLLASPTFILTVFTFLPLRYTTAAAPIPFSMPGPSPYACTSLLSILSIIVAFCIDSGISSWTFVCQCSGNRADLMVSMSSGLMLKSRASSWSADVLEGGMLYVSMPSVDRPLPVSAWAVGWRVNPVCLLLSSSLLWL
ncbi:hypothetical protein DFS33DRAFT_930183 [Desarmillaria ectypa]|nr:hypothetical protein DFS33DRAFT_930183 [Desarmillaria ectypa]